MKEERKKEIRWTEAKFSRVVFSNAIKVSGTYTVDLAMEKPRDVVYKHFAFVCYRTSWYQSTKCSIKSTKRSPWPSGCLYCLTSFCIPPHNLLKPTMGNISIKLHLKLKMSLIKKKNRNKGEMKQRQKTTWHLQKIHGRCRVVLRSFISVLFLSFFQAPSLTEMKFYRNFSP